MGKGRSIIPYQCEYLWISYCHVQCTLCTWTFVLVIVIYHSCFIVMLCNFTFTFWFVMDKISSFWWTVNGHLYGLYWVLMGPYRALIWVPTVHWFGSLLGTYGSNVSESRDLNQVRKDRHCLEKRWYLVFDNIKADITIAAIARIKIFSYLHNLTLGVVRMPRCQQACIGKEHSHSQSPCQTWKRIFAYIFSCSSNFLDIYF